MIQTIIGRKIDQSQRFLENGMRVPVTEVFIPKSPVVAHKTKDKDGYEAIQIAFGERKRSSKASLGHVKKAGLQKAPKAIREVRVEGTDIPAVGTFISVSDVLKPGDIIDVRGVGKGKGYAGVVKRHHFKGGPRTHGQSDRERAPGSIGQTTTPGRVYKGKRMAGRMGMANTTIKNLRIVAVMAESVLIKGLVPGAKNSLVVIEKVGEDNKFPGLYEEKVETKEVQEEKKEEVK